MAIYVIKPYDALCELQLFIVNGKKADKDEFGSQQDESPEEAEEYGCGNMTFRCNPPTRYVLEKYNLTKEEYDTICEELTVALSFGRCGWCI